MGLLFGRTEPLLGLDISASAIKLVELGRTRGGYVLKSLAHVPLPKDVIVDQTVMDSVALQQALLDALEVARPSTHRAAIALAGNAVITKTVQFPAMTELELEGQIEVLADEHMPFAMDEVYLDFQILGTSGEDETQMDVVLVACKREIVDDFQTALHDAGLELAVVDCAVFALENALEITPMHGVPPNVEELSPEDAEVHALVYIGATMTHVNVAINGQMAFVRDHFFGGQSLTEEIAKAQGLSFEEAEKLKCERPEEIPPEAMENFYAGLVGELQRALDYYSASKPDYPVKKILLTGGGALVPGIAGELGGRLGIDTELVNIFDAVEVPEKQFDRAHLARVGPMFTIGVGLALRSFDA